MGEWLVGGAVRTHTTLINQVHCLTWAWFLVPQNSTTVTSKITDSRLPYKYSEKVYNIVQITKT